MQKITNVLFTLAFTVGCFGQWLMLVLFQSIYPLRLEDSLPGFTIFLVGNKMLFLIIPIPFLLFSLFLVLKKTPTTEINLLYCGILAVVFSLLFFLVVAAVWLPWVPMIKNAISS
jgi:hypothetical protein